MYLTQILGVDLRWLGEDWLTRMEDEDLEDDEKCVDYLHRHKTIRLLQKVIDEVGLDNFKAVFEHFKSIKNAGYTVEEVVQTDTEHLIDRSERDENSLTAEAVAMRLLFSQQQD